MSINCKLTLTLTLTPTLTHTYMHAGKGYLRVLEHGDEVEDESKLIKHLIQIPDIPDHDLPSRQFLSPAVLMYLSSVHLSKQASMQQVIYTY